MKFVLDASAALAWTLPDATPEQRSYSDAVLDVLQRDAATAAVPLLWHEEVADVLLSRRRAKAISERDLELALDVFNRLILETHMNAYALPILIERARRYGLRAYDAVYFDLAKVLSLPIATLDSGIVAAAKLHGVKLFAP